MADPYAWHDRAPCRGRVDLFDPPEPTDDTERQARDICRGCTVLRDCAKWVFSLPSHADPGGIAAGMTEKQRQTIRYSRSKQVVAYRKALAS